MGRGAQVQVVLVAAVRVQREAPGEIERPRGVPAAGDGAAAEVEQRAQPGAAVRRRRPRGLGRDAEEVFDERRYDPTTERIRPAIASTPGTIASSSSGL
jgi:hypothetical protein